MAFEYTKPESWDLVVHALQRPGARALGGGTDLIPLIREHRASPDLVVDVRGVRDAQRMSWDTEGTLTVGAAVSLRQLAKDPKVAAAFPALSMACAAVGSYALRNMGTLGGNLCQQVRCWYYRHGHECLKSGDSRCSAQSGQNQYHAIFQQGPCVAVHPSDPAVALCALEATVHVRGAGGERRVPCAEFFAPSSVQLDRETTLAPGEVVTAVDVPARSSGGVQFYDKTMQRAAWDFALVSLAAIRRTDGEVRLVLGGVANTPWRVTDSIEEDVASGGLASDDVETLAQRAMYDAQALTGNAYKVEIAGAMLRRAMVRLTA